MVAKTYTVTLGFIGESIGYYDGFGGSIAPPSEVQACFVSGIATGRPEPELVIGGYGATGLFSDNTSNIVTLLWNGHRYTLKHDPNFGGIGAYVFIGMEAVPLQDAWYGGGAGTTQDVTIEYATAVDVPDVDRSELRMKKNTWFQTKNHARPAKNQVSKMFIDPVLGTADGGGSPYGEKYAIGIEIPTDGYTLNVTTSGTTVGEIDYGDGTVLPVASSADPNLTHTYATAGEYTLTFDGTCSRLWWDGTGHESVIRHLYQFGKCGWTSMRQHFRDCGGMLSINSGVCDTSNVTDWSDTFRTTTIPAGNLIDVSTIDSSSGTTFGGLFLSTGIPGMTGPLDLSNWDFSGTSSLSSTFRNFNPTDVIWPANISDVSPTSLQSCFRTTSAVANVNLAAFDMTRCASCLDMCREVTLPEGQLDDIYNSWSQQAVLSNVTAHFGGSKYSAASQAAKDILVGKGWIITDGGLL